MISHWHLLLAFSAVIAYGSSGGFGASTTGLCTNPSKRQEWRSLDNKQKIAYIEAVKCLQALPAIGPVKDAKTRFDDFQALHIALTDEIHNVGQFLPWHRRMLNVHETALRTACGYKGPYTYWDYTIDVNKTGTFLHSPVFDSVYGFGGNGIDIPGYNGQFNNMSDIPDWLPGTGGGCITDGPFATYNLSLGPGTLVTNHCLQRAFDDNFSAYLTSSLMESTLELTPFESFRTVLEGIRSIPGAFGLHGGGHFAVSGEMGNLYSSPGDPLFYLHHANLDRVWWLWQTADLRTRLYAISGVSSVDPPFVNVTLDFELKMNGLAPLVKIRDVMDIRNDLMCYTY